MAGHSHKKESYTIEQNSHPRFIGGGEWKGRGNRRELWERAVEERRMHGRRPA